MACGGRVGTRMATSRRSGRVRRGSPRWTCRRSIAIPASRLPQAGQTAGPRGASQVSRGAVEDSGGSRGGSPSASSSCRPLSIGDHRRGAFRGDALPAPVSARLAGGGLGGIRPGRNERRGPRADSHRRDARAGVRHLARPVRPWRRTHWKHRVGLWSRGFGARVPRLRLVHGSGRLMARRWVAIGRGSLHSPAISCTGSTTGAWRRPSIKSSAFQWRPSKRS